MNRDLIRLAQRREQLLIRAATQRTALARAIEPWCIPLALADQGLAALRYIRRHPAWTVGAIGLVAALRPGRAVTWLRRGWVGWQIIRELRGK